MKNFKLFENIVKYSIALTLIILISCSTGIEKKETFSVIDNIMELAVKDSVFPGAVLLFGINQNVLYNKAFGNYTYDKNSANVKTNSIFDLASVSKVAATTSAAMLLVQENKLNLNDKVVKYLPEFNNNGKDEITIRNILLHNTGLPAFKKYYDEYSTAAEVIDDIMNLELNSKPGEKYVYSDLGMITLQKVIEKITNKTLDVFLKENLFAVLDMNRTMYNPSEEMKKECVPTEDDDFYRMRLLQGEVHDERAYMLNGVAGHAGLFSTAEDLSKLVRTYLNNGKYKNKQIFKPEILSEWTTKQTAQSTRGLGWDTKTIDGYSSAGNYFSGNSFGHTGYTGTSVWVDKDSKLFVILLSNRVHPTRANRKISQFRPIIHDAIYRALFDNGKDAFKN